MERARSDTGDDRSPRRPGPGPNVVAAASAARSRGPAPTGVLALQRAIGNRAATRVLARWTPHPDKGKKGQFMTDETAAAWNRFNPPLSK